MSSPLPILPAGSLYPLPDDYASLTTGGQREARVNAASQWLLDGPDPGIRLCASVNFFENYYLRADPDADFDPLFFKKGWLPSAPFHWELIRAFGEADFLQAVCPRGSAKSTKLEVVSMLELLTRPGWQIVYCTSSNTNANERSSNIREQVYDNPRIIEDFGPLYGGRLRPTRGVAPTGVEFFKLTNKSWIRFLSSGSRVRGVRPNVFDLDDIEFDSSATTSAEILRQYAERLIFRLVLPALNNGNCKARWTATFVSKQHYSYHAMETKTLPNGKVVSTDPRFDYWRRIFVDVLYQDAQGHTRSCWPEMWPVTNAERDADPALKNRRTLEEIEGSMGHAAWLSEYRGRPGETSSSFFSLTEPLHGYSLTNVDQTYATNPRESLASITYFHQDKQVTKPISALLKGSRMALVGDTSFTSGPASDFKACMLYTLTPDNLLFILDAWAGRGAESILVRKCFEMAQRWRAPIIYPEVVRQGYSFYTALQSIVNTRSLDTFQLLHVPAIRPLRPGPMDKSSKISGLSFRFTHGLLKFPLFLRNRDPAFTSLFGQIEGFNPDANDGGLQNDDLLDCLSMSNLVYVQQGRPSHQPGAPRPARSAVEQLASGLVNDEFGNPIAASVGLNNLPLDLVMSLIRKHNTPEQKNGDPDYSDGLYHSKA